MADLEPTNPLYQASPRSGRVEPRPILPSPGFEWGNFGGSLKPGIGPEGIVSTNVDGPIVGVDETVSTSERRFDEELELAAVYQVLEQTTTASHRQRLAQRLEWYLTLGEPARSLLRDWYQTVAGYVTGFDNRVTDYIRAYDKALGNTATLTGLADRMGFYLPRVDPDAIDVAFYERFGVMIRAQVRLGKDLDSSLTINQIQLPSLSGMIEMTRSTFDQFLIHLGQRPQTTAYEDRLDLWLQLLDTTE